MKKNNLKQYLSILLLTLASCASIPEGIEPVTNFKIDLYLGKWYEIARLDHSFERGLQYVTAEYSRHENGGIRVINRGLNQQTNSWNKAEGRAYFVETNDKGYLKVSFFRPFYGAYVIFKLGKNYEYALITSNDRSYLWILSRTPTITSELKTELIKQISQQGFKTQELIFVKQEN